MPIRNYRTSTKFEPLSDDLLIKLAELPTIEHKKLESDLNDVGALAGTVGEYAQNGKKSREMYNQFQDNLKLAAQGLATGGLSGASRSAAMNLKSLYGSNIQPIIDAQKRQEKQVEQWNKIILEHPYFLGADPSKRSPDDYLSGSPELRGIDGDDIKKQATNSAALASADLVRRGRPTPDGYGNIVETKFTGYTPDEQAEFLRQYTLWKTNGNPVSDKYQHLLPAIEALRKSVDYKTYGVTEKEVEPYIIRGFIDGMLGKEETERYRDHRAEDALTRIKIRKETTPTPQQLPDLFGTPTEFVGVRKPQELPGFKDFFKEVDGKYVPKDPTQMIIGVYSTNATRTKFHKLREGSANEKALHRSELENKFNLFTKNGDGTYRLKLKREIYEEMKRENIKLQQSGSPERYMFGDKEKKAYDDFVALYAAQGIDLSSINNEFMTNKYKPIKHRNRSASYDIIGMLDFDMFNSNSGKSDAALSALEYPVNPSSYGFVRNKINSLAGSKEFLGTTSGADGSFSSRQGGSTLLSEKENPVAVFSVPGLKAKIVRVIDNSKLEGIKNPTEEDRRKATRDILVPIGMFSKADGTGRYTLDQYDILNSLGDLADVGLTPEQQIVYGRTLVEHDSDMMNSLQGIATYSPTEKMRTASNGLGEVE